MAAVWRHLALWVVLQACLSDLGSARGGGSSGGRSSGSSRGYFSSRGGYGGSRIHYKPSSNVRRASPTSRYITYNPGVRYSRVYSVSRMSSYYFYYYHMYFSYYGSPAYYSRRPVTPTSTVCVNYEANDNGSYIGVFVCPMSFEPDSFQSCCGDEYAEFCCKEDKVALYVMLGIGLSIVIFITLFITIYCCCKKHTHFKENVLVAPEGQRPGQGRPQHQGQPPPLQGQRTQFSNHNQRQHSQPPPYPPQPMNNGVLREPVFSRQPNHEIFTVSAAPGIGNPPPYAAQRQPALPPPSYSSLVNEPKKSDGGYTIPPYPPVQPPPPPAQAMYSSYPVSN